MLKQCTPTNGYHAKELLQKLFKNNSVYYNDKLLEMMQQVPYLNYNCILKVGHKLKRHTMISQ